MFLRNFPIRHFLISLPKKLFSIKIGDKIPNIKLSLIKYYTLNLNF